MKIAREGIPYITGLLFISGVLVLLHFVWAAAIFFGLSLFVIFFFRDPERVFSGDANKVCSPADGKVVSIRKEGDSEAVSIFLSVFNVHVNRAPIAGKVSKVEYHRGKFLLAFDERASTENERNLITIERPGKSAVTFVQIAGLIARRIVCWKKEGEVLSAGERIGLIKFGSRVDIFLPAGSSIHVKLGQKVRGGESVIGELQ